MAVADRREARRRRSEKLVAMSVVPIASGSPTAVFGWVGGRVL
jgi:hypothetical protein